LDKIHCIMAYIYTYLWGLSLIILIFLIYVSIRDPLNIIHRFPTGKNFKMEWFLINLLMLIVFLSTINGE
jgi:hypothetical protein